jgi:molybdopterin converting factor small subunit
MRVTFHIPAALREFTNGVSQVQLQVPAGTMADALSALWTAYPGIRDRVINEQSQIRQHINIFVGNENIRYTGGLSTQVPDQAQISIVPAVSGGAQRTLCSVDLGGVGGG